MDILSYAIGKKAGGGDTPTGTIDITQNGTYNVSSYASADVDVQPDLESKSVTISTNTTTTITPTQGKDGLSSVEVTTNVPQPSGKIEITQNGTDIDVSSYATADVNVSGGTVNPTNYAELNAAIYDAATPLANTMNALVDAKSAYTNDNVTLYAPNSKCNRYFIRKNTSNTYNAVWVGYGDSNNTSVPYVLFRSGYGFHLGRDYGDVANNPNTAIPFKFNPTTNRYEGNATSVGGIYYQHTLEFSGRTCYYSNALSTPEEIIQGMMNNTLTYTQSPGYLNGTELLYSNFVIFGTNTETFNQSFTISEPIQATINTPIISHNETIVSAS